MKNKLKYFLISILYCMYMDRVKNNLLRYSYTKSVFSAIENNFFTENFKKKIENKREEFADVNHDYIFGVNNGLCITWARKILFFLCFDYFSIIVFPILGLIDKYYPNDGDLYNLIFLLLFGISLMSYLESMIGSDSNYTDYFHMFHHNEKKWFKKWKVISSIFPIGAFISIVVGLIIMIYIKNPSAFLYY